MVTVSSSSRPRFIKDATEFVDGRRFFWIRRVVVVIIMSCAIALTKSQTEFHADLERWARAGSFGTTTSTSTNDDPTTTGGEQNSLSVFYDRLDSVVDSHFDVEAFERHAWYLRDSPATGADKLGALRIFQATVRAKHDASFPPEDDCDGSGGGSGGDWKTRCAIS